MNTTTKRLHDEHRSASKRTHAQRFTIEDVRRLVASPTLKNAGTTRLRDGD